MTEEQRKEYERLSEQKFLEEIPLTYDEIINHITVRSETEDAAEKLFEKAIANGGKDNISVIVCKISE